MPASWGYAYHKDLKKTINITDASNGLKCNCICLECGQPLEAVQGTQRQPHFRHYRDKGCGGAPETILHLRAKQFLCAGSKLMTPVGEINYMGAVPENREQHFKPDVTFWVNGQRWFVEIIVTSHVSEQKRNLYLDRPEKVLLVDLSYVPYNIPDEDLKMILFQETGNKSFIEPEVAIAAPVQPLVDIWKQVAELAAFIFGAIVLFLFFRWLAHPKNNRHGR